MQTKISLLFSILFITFTAMAQTPQPHTLIGTTAVKQLHKNADCPWYDSGYKAYLPDAATVAALNKTFPQDAKLLVFGGSWCSDTQYLLPQFFKTTDQAGIPNEAIQLYFLDEQKQSPGKLEQVHNVTHVPTFILLVNGKEKGRIVESVQQSVEKDLLQLIQ